MSSRIHRLFLHGIVAAVLLWVRSAVAGIVLVPVLAWGIAAIVGGLIVTAGAIIKLNFDDGGLRQHGLCPSRPDQRPGHDAGRVIDTRPGTGALPGAGSDTGIHPPIPGSKGLIPGSLSPSEGLGQLELNFRRRADLKYLVYTLAYRPANRSDPNEAVFVHHGRANPQGVEVLAPAQIAEQAQRLGWEPGQLPRLCARGTRLSPGQLECTVVLRVRPGPPPRPTPQGNVWYFATRVPALAGSPDDGNLELQPSTVQAQAGVALRNVMFVALRQPRSEADGPARDVIYQVERDAVRDSPARKTIVPWGTAQPWGAGLARMTLSRDGSRVYLATTWGIREWTGQGSFSSILELAGEQPGSVLAGLGVTDHGVCSVMQLWSGYLEEPQPHYDFEGIGAWRMQLLCKGQHVQAWNDLVDLPLPRRTQQPHSFRAFREQYELASVGDSVMVVWPYLNDFGYMLAAYVPDALSPYASAVRVPVYQNTLVDRRLSARFVLPLGCDGGGGPQQYLLGGILPDPLSPEVNAILALPVLPHGPGGEPQFGPLRVVRPRGASEPELTFDSDAMRLWRVAGVQGMVGLYEYRRGIHELRVTDYSQRLGRPLASHSFTLVGKWDDGGGFEVLSDPAETSPTSLELALTGTRGKLVMARPVLWLRPLSATSPGGVLAPPQRYVDFGDEAKLLAQQPVASNVRVVGVTSDTVMLVPVEPQA